MIFFNNILWVSSFAFICYFLHVTEKINYLHKEFFFLLNQKNCFCLKYYLHLMLHKTFKRFFYGQFIELLHLLPEFINQFSTSLGSKKPGFTLQSFFLTEKIRKPFFFEENFCQNSAENRLRDWCQKQKSNFYSFSLTLKSSNQLILCFMGKYLWKNLNHNIFSDQHSFC